MSLGEAFEVSKACAKPRISLALFACQDVALNYCSSARLPSTMTMNSFSRSKSPTDCFL